MIQDMAENQKHGLQAAPKVSFLSGQKTMQERLVSQKKETRQCRKRLKYIYVQP